MKKNILNKVLTVLGKSELIYDYNIFVTLESDGFDENGKPINLNWCIELEYINTIISPNKSKMKLKYIMLEQLLNDLCPDCNVYLLNSNNYKVIEID